MIMEKLSTKKLLVGVEKGDHARKRSIFSQKFHMTVEGSNCRLSSSDCDGTQSWNFMPAITVQVKGSKVINM